MTNTDTPSAAALPAGPLLCFPASLALVALRGEDAASFLHGQLTQSVEDLAIGEVRLAGYCSPKGRLLASGWLWREADGLRLLVSADLADALVKRLRMYVLRARVEITRLDGAVRLIGLIDGGAVDGARAFGEAAGRQRRLLVVDAAMAERTVAALGAQFQTVDAGVWDWLEVRSGVARIVAATQELFVPQMINFELVGAVHFRKGCYPGQEVVARSQYRGAVKRRLQLFHVDVAASAPADAVRPGQPVFAANASDTPVGTVANAAVAPAGGVDLLVELRLDAIAMGDLRLGDAAGPALLRQDLPYAVGDALAGAA